MGKLRVWGAVAAAAVGLIAGGCAQPPSTGGGGTGGPATTWSVNPKTTDPAIANDATYTHLAYAPTGPALGKLAVVLHGTGSSPQAYTELAGSLRSAGFHVIVLRYSAVLGTLAACPDSGAAADPDCHRTFRSETVFGAGVPDPAGHAYDHAAVAINGANSVMNRLLKLVDYLQTIAPASGWGAFQQRTGATCTSVNTTYGACDLDWSNVVTVGHSQGAGVALYLGKFFPLSKVEMLSGSYDAYNTGGGSFTVAPWVSEGGLAVANADIGTLLHTSDYGVPLFRAVEDALNVTGPEVSLTSSSPPFGGSHRLVTSLASTCPWDSVPGHNSTAVDLCAPDFTYWAAWQYLAGA
jgi:hypothetical protein